MAAPVGKSSIDLRALVAQLRAHAGLTGKEPIAAITEHLDVNDPVHGPGDDGAVVELTDGGRVVACGEALFPPFVAADPYGAGVAAVLANVNDVAAMGGVPQAIVNTIVGPPELAAEAMRGMSHASAIYDVPIVGGHLTRSQDATSLSAFAVGQVEQVLSMANVEPGQHLVFVCSLDGKMRDDFPFFTSLDNQAPRLARDIRLLNRAAKDGLAVAAKDVSMAGPIGSLAMLLEFTKLGTTIDLDVLPAPVDADYGTWLMCFPTFAFWLAVPEEQVEDCVGFFRGFELEARSVGVVSGHDTSLSLSLGGETVEVMDFARETVTGLWPAPTPATR